MAIKKTDQAPGAAEWELAQEQVKELPAFLAPWELTAQRYAKRNNISEYTAERILDKLVAEGVLVKEPRRRKGQGGHPTQAYVKK